MRAECGERRARCRGYSYQALIVIIINVPNLVLGLSMGWVSMWSGGGGGGAGTGAGAVAGAEWVAGATFAGALLAAPLIGTLTRHGRRPAMVIASLLFLASWCVTLWSGGGGWWLAVARLCAGFGGATAWDVATLLAKEMCSGSWSGAGACAPTVAYNAGVLIMYAVADAGLQPGVSEWYCALVSAGSCVACCFVPESPSFLAAAGDTQGALSTLSWLRGADSGAPALQAELSTLPAPDDDQDCSFSRVKQLCSDRRRRRALAVSCAAMAQEACGVGALLQFAAPVLAQALDQHHRTSANEFDDSVPPTGSTVVLGAAQMVASLLALYLVERVGRRRLLLCSSVLVSLSLAVAAGAVATGAARGGGGGGALAAGALAAAVAADALGVQPTPYVLLSDMFHYQWRGCALVLATMVSECGSCVEAVWFAAVSRGSLPTALAISAAATALYAAFIAVAVTETKGKTVEEIYAEMYPSKVPYVGHKDTEGKVVPQNCSKKPAANDVTVTVQCPHVIETVWTRF